MFVSPDTTIGRYAIANGDLVSESDIEKVYDVLGDTVVVVDNPATYNVPVDVKPVPRWKTYWKYLRPVVLFVAGMLTGLPF